MSYIKPQITPPSPLIFAILIGGSKRRVNSADLGSPRGKPAEKTRHLTWVDAWVRFGLAHFLQRLIVFWWFLQTYMTSGPCSSWFFLVMKRWFFWYYLWLQVMAILCRAAKNSLRGTKGLKKANFRRCRSYLHFAKHRHTEGFTNVNAFIQLCLTSTLFC